MSITFSVGEFNYLKTSENECTLGNNPEISGNAPIVGQEFTGEAIIPPFVEYNQVNYTVTVIGRYAFRYCSKMTGIKIPSTVRTLSYDMILGTKVTNVMIPSSVIEIQNSTFSHADSLVSIYFEASSQIKIINGSSFASAHHLKYLILPSSVEKIETNAFSNDNDLEFIIYCGSHDMSELASNIFGTVTNKVDVYVTKNYPKNTLAGKQVKILNNYCISSMMPLIIKHTKIITWSLRLPSILIYAVIFIQ